MLATSMSIFIIAPDGMFGFTHEVAPKQSRSSRAVKRRPIDICRRSMRPWLRRSKVDRLKSVNRNMAQFASGKVWHSINMCLMAWGLRNSSEVQSFEGVPQTHRNRFEITENFLGTCFWMAVKHEDMHTIDATSPTFHGILPRNARICISGPSSAKGEAEKNVDEKKKLYSI